MTQLEPTPESSPHQSKREMPKDATQPSDDRLAPEASEAAPDAETEVTDKEGPTSIMNSLSVLRGLTYQPADGYRPPEAVMDSSNDAWRGDFNEPWELTQTKNWEEYGSGSPTGWRDTWPAARDGVSQWADKQPDVSDWGNLGVIGTDEPWRDNSDKWWDRELQRSRRRPGPGMLAPRAIEAMHDSDHILYEVTITGNPSTEPSTALSPKASIRSVGALNAPNPSVPSTSTPAVTTPAPASAVGAKETTPEPDVEVNPHVTPTAEELRDAIPHPSALYCRRHLGWFVVSIITASATASHLGTHWCADPDKKAIFDTLPDPTLRNDKDCLERETSPNKGSLYATINWSNEKEPKMHHFHVYHNVVAGSGLYPPLKRQISTVSAPVPASSSNPGGDVDMTSQSQVLEVEDTAEVAPETTWKEAPPTEHLDLYMCCQCKTQVICSPDGGVIPCVIPADAIEGFIQERGSHPKPGQTPEQSAFTSLEMIMRLEASARACVSAYPTETLGL